MLGYGSFHGWKEHPSEDFGVLDHAQLAALSRFFALLIKRAEVIVALRRLALLPGKDRTAELALFRGNLDGTPTKTDSIEVSALDGFDLQLLPTQGSKPMLLHFKHGGHFLSATAWNDRQWQSRLLGRQGDGMYLQAGVCHSNRQGWLRVLRRHSTN